MPTATGGTNQGGYRAGSARGVRVSDWEEVLRERKPSTIRGTKILATAGSALVGLGLAVAAFRSFLSAGVHPVSIQGVCQLVSRRRGYSQTRNRIIVHHMHTLRSTDLQDTGLRVADLRSCLGYEV